MSVVGRGWDSAFELVNAYWGPTDGSRGSPNQSKASRAQTGLFWKEEILQNEAATPAPVAAVPPYRCQTPQPHNHLSESKTHLSPKKPG